jgi:hypothetical protein
VILSLSSSRGTFAMSIPSINILPLKISTIRLKAKLIVLFPAPVLPTIPIFSPAFVVKVKPFNTVSVSGRYFK